MKIIIFGASGEIGSTLQKHLKKFQYKVFGITSKKNSKKNKYWNYYDKKKFPFDINNDVIVIAISPIVRGQDNSKEQIKNINNYLISIYNIIELIKNKKCKVILLSSAVVYPVSNLLIKNTKIPDYEISGVPYHNIGLAIRLAENAIAEISNSGINSLIMRISTVYGILGNGKLASGIVRDLILKIRDCTGTLTLSLNPKIKRNFILIDDLNSTIECYIGKEISGSEIINLGSSNNHTFKYLIETIMNILKKENKVYYKIDTSQNRALFINSDAICFKDTSLKVGLSNTIKKIKNYDNC